MTMTRRDAQGIVAALEPPVLVISSAAGRGMYSIGEAIRDALADTIPIHHVAIEELLPPTAASEDLYRYRRICDHVPSLLWLVYDVPLFYRRKYEREVRGRGTDLQTLRDTVAQLGARTVVAISHRAAFWASVLKQRDAVDYRLWALEAEYGPSLGWRYLCWGVIDGFMSPRRIEAHTYPLSPGTTVHEVAIPVREEFRALARQMGDRNEVLLTGGSWGLGPLFTVATELVNTMPRLGVTVVCGENQRLQRRLAATIGTSSNARVFGVVHSLAPLLERAGAVITKPGISTIAEAHAAGRQLFLLRGLPVAEEHNAQHAIAHLGARWYSLAGFARWHRSM